MRSIMRGIYAPLRLLSTEASSAQHTGLVHVEKQFESVPPSERNKEAFYAALIIFKERQPRSYVDFLHSALKYMKDFGVHKDLEAYKALLNIFPKGKLIPQNQWQKIFLHYPLQQNCCVKVLDEMEWHGVQPDKETHDIVVNAFGEWNFATRKVKRMLYWMPKLRHSNKYLDRRLLEKGPLSQADLAGLLLRTISRDPGSKLHLWKSPSTSNSVNNEWIAYSQSILQKNLISRLDPMTDIFIDGPFLSYVMDKPVKYVTIKCLPDGALQDFQPKEENDDYANWFQEWTESRTFRRTIHEQKNETILGLACLSTFNNAMAQRLVELLNAHTPKLSEMNIRLRLDK
ncbi:unnamed protein product, partial [Mesorhabditis belari]|uniref:Evolutionarily conserved signaling intermediate in Toll pathway, mitochondrial n=1 Tax=Mesorhabditis belari TaxID=2138241 RepID=A0AAF3JAF6_9BILA